jgi:type I restriction enzyme M protein
MGAMFDRTHKELTNDDIKKIAGTYRAYRGEKTDISYQDVEGFCKRATLDDIKQNDYVLTPGRYVGVEEIEDDGIPFDEKMRKLTTDLFEQLEKSEELGKKIKRQLEEIGYES